MRSRIASTHSAAMGAMPEGRSSIGVSMMRSTSHD
jgi:hypothetical protein